MEWHRFCHEIAGGRSKQLHQITDCGLSKAAELFYSLLLPQLPEAHNLQRNWKMWRTVGLERVFKICNSRRAFRASNAWRLVGAYPAVTCVVVLSPTNMPAGGVLFPCWLFYCHLESLGNCKQRFRTLIKCQAPMWLTLRRTKIKSLAGEQLAWGNPSHMGWCRAIGGQEQGSGMREKGISLLKPKT